MKVFTEGDAMAANRETLFAEWCRQRDRALAAEDEVKRLERRWTERYTDWVEGVEVFLRIVGFGFAAAFALALSFGSLTGAVVGILLWAGVI